MEIIKIERKFKKYLPSEFNKEIVENATIVKFTDREFEEPEMVFWEKRKVRVSDYNQGLAQWDKSKRQYVSMFYGSERPIGKCEYILVEATQ